MAHQAKYPVGRMCLALAVMTSGYYAWGAPFSLHKRTVQTSNICRTLSDLGGSLCAANHANGAGGP
jgi:hypothetical protein